MAKTNPFGLTDQMFLFCQEYVTRGFKDATGAYRAAYPKCSEKSAAHWKFIDGRLYCHMHRVEIRVISASYETAPP